MQEQRVLYYGLQMHKQMVAAIRKNIAHIRQFAINLVVGKQYEIRNSDMILNPGGIFIFNHFEMQVNGHNEVITIDDVVEYYTEIWEDDFFDTAVDLIQYCFVDEFGGEFKLGDLLYGTELIISLPTQPRISVVKTRKKIRGGNTFKSPTIV